MWDANVRRTGRRADTAAGPPPQAVVGDADIDRAGAGPAGRCPARRRGRNTDEPQQPAAFGQSGSRPRGWLVRVLGVDDFAVDEGITTAPFRSTARPRRVVAPIPGRDTSPVAEWLLQHEPPAVICQARARPYAERRSDRSIGRGCRSPNASMSGRTSAPRSSDWSPSARAAWSSNPPRRSRGSHRAAPRRDGAAPPGQPSPGPRDVCVRRRLLCRCDLLRSGGGFSTTPFETNVECLRWRPSRATSATGLTASHTTDRVTDRLCSFLNRCARNMAPWFSEGI